MPRIRPFPPPPKGRPKEFLFNAETSETSTDEPEDNKRGGRRQRGEKVEAPSAELIPQAKQDWGKIGVYVALGLAGIGAVYNYADLASLVRNTAVDVQEIKRRTDDLIRSSIDASARIAALERREAPAPPSPANPPPSPASK